MKSELELATELAECSAELIGLEMTREETAKCGRLLFFILEIWGLELVNGQDGTEEPAHKPGPDPS